MAQTNQNKTATPPSSTKGVQTLLGNPKQAIIKLSIPMIIAMSVQTLYNFVDALWVSGLGPDALSAVGFFFPFFFIILAIAIGIGVGGSSALSRKIGAHDKAGADNIASHSIVMMLIASAVLTIPFFLLAPKIFALMGAGPIGPITTGYARILFAGTVVIFFSNISSALLRGEGDVNRAMIVMMVGAGLNIILDPIFIYILHLGVSGAAWATLISLCVSSLFLFHWLFIKRNTYVNISLRRFRFRKIVLSDILKVGIPSSIMQMAMSFTVFFITLIAVKVGGTDAVAVFTTGWRMVMFATLPLIGMATAVVSVTGAAFGGKAYGKLNTAYMYAIKIGVFIELVVAAVTYILAPQIAWLFTTAKEGIRIRPDLIAFLRITCVFYGGVPFGMLSSAMFQGIGKGTYSLIVTIIRTIVLTTSLAWLFAVGFHWQLVGVWWGIVVGNIIGSIIAFTWGRLLTQRLISGSPQPS